MVRQKMLTRQDDLGMEKVLRNKQQPAMAGKKYSSPKLHKFGRVRELTTGGSAGPSEMSNTGDQMKMP
jgi:hypothetical protein